MIRPIPCLLLAVWLTGVRGQPTAECLHDLGMQDGKIKDADIRVSSERANQTKDMARLGHFEDTCGAAWCPDVGDVSPFYEIHLNKPTRVSALVFRHPTSANHHCHNYASEFIKTFRLLFKPALGTESLVQYNENIDAIVNKSLAYNIQLVPPIVTTTIRIVPLTSEHSPCFKLAILGCEPTSLCKKDFCENGGKCIGSNFCQCPDNFYGDRCQNTVDKLVIYKFLFERIINEVLMTTSYNMSVSGHVDIEKTGGQSMVVLQQGGSLVLDLQQAHVCFQDLSHCSSGITYSLTVNIEKMTSTRMSFLTSGMDLNKDNGIWLFYEGDRMSCMLASGASVWQIEKKWTPSLSRWYKIEMSWQKELGLQLLIDGHLVGNVVQPNQRAPVAPGSTHLTIGSSNNVDSVIRIFALSLAPLFRSEVIRANITHDLTPPVVTPHHTNNACNVALGMQDGTVTDNQLTVSSSQPGHPKTDARLGPRTGTTAGKAWCPQTAAGSFFEVSFPKVMAIGGIRFQHPLIKGTTLPTRYLKTYRFLFKNSYMEETNYTEFSQDIPAMPNATTAYTVSFDPIIVTDVIRIEPQTWEKAPCFRFELSGCDPVDLCEVDFCKNHGTCIGKDMCSCPAGFYGTDCSVKKVSVTIFTFLRIVNNLLVTSIHNFTTHGHVDLDHNMNIILKKDATVEMTSPGQCLLDLDHCTSGFTFSLTVNFNQLTNEKFYLLTSGGDKAGTKGISLYYQSGHLYCYVTISNKRWVLQVPYTLHTSHWYRFHISWNRNLGLHLYEKDQLIGSIFSSTPTHATKSQPLTIGNNLNSIGNLWMIIHQLQTANQIYKEIEKSGITEAPLPPTPPPVVTSPAATTETPTNCKSSMTDISFTKINGTDLLTSLSTMKVHGDVSLEQGTEGTMLVLDGKDQYIDMQKTGVPCIDDLTTCKTSFNFRLTFQFIKIDTMHNYILSSGGNMQDSNGIALYYWDNRLNFWVKEGTNVGKSIYNVTMTTGVWYTLDASWDKDTRETNIYLNGKDLVKNKPGFNAAPMPTEKHTLLIGKSPDQTHTSHIKLLLFRMWTESRNNLLQNNCTEVIEIPVLPTAVIPAATTETPTNCKSSMTDISFTKINGTDLLTSLSTMKVHGNASLEQGTEGTMLVLDGKDQYIDMQKTGVPCIDDLTTCKTSFNFRLTFQFIKIDILQNYILSSGGSMQNSSGISLSYWNGQLNFWVKDGVNVGMSIYEIDLTAGTWYTLDASWDKSTESTSLYLNGQALMSKITNNHPAPDTTEKYSLLIGKSPDQNHTSHIKILLFRMWTENHNKLVEANCTEVTKIPRISMQTPVSQAPILSTSIETTPASSLPKKNIQTLDLSIQSIQGSILVTQSTNLTIHGHVKLVKVMGVTFVSLSSSNAWIEVPRQHIPCMNHLETCQSGFTFQVTIMIQKMNPSDKFVILSNGNETSSTINLYYKDNTLHASIIRGEHMWTLVVSYTLTTKHTYMYQVSWSRTEGLTLFVDNVLVGTERQWITVQNSLVVNESLHIGRTDGEIFLTNIQMWTATRQVLGQIGILNKISNTTPQLQKEITTKTILSSTTPKPVIVTFSELKTHTASSLLQSQTTINGITPTKTSFQPKEQTTNDKTLSSTPLTINEHTTKMSTALVTQLTKNETSTEDYTTSPTSLSPNKEVTTQHLNPSASSLPKKENIQTVDLSIQSIQGPILVTQSTNLTIHGQVKLVKDNGVTFVSLSGSNAWIEVPRQYIPCMNHFQTCQSGFTFQVTIMIQKMNPSDKFVILSNGNETSSTMNLYYKANTLHASIIRGEHMWTLVVSYTLTTKHTYMYQVSWSRTEGLTLFVDNVLVGTERQWITVQNSLVVNESLHIGRTEGEILVTNIQMWTATRQVLGQIGILNKISNTTPQLQMETTTESILSSSTPKPVKVTSSELKTHTTSSLLGSRTTTNSKTPTKTSFQPKELTTKDNMLSSTPLTINEYTTKMSTAPVTQLAKNGTSTGGKTTSPDTLSPNKEVTTQHLNPSTSSLPTKKNIQTVDLSIQSIQGPILVTQSTNLTIHGHVKLVKDNGVTFVSLSGSNAWIEVPRQRFPCMNHLESCQSGFTFQVAILIQKMNPSDKFVFLSNGNEISSTMNLYYEANTLHASIIRGEHMWTLAVSYTLTMRQTHTYQVSWSTTEGLTLFVDNVLVGTEHQWITVQNNLVVNESLHIGRTDGEIFVTNIQMWTATREVLGQIGILNKISITPPQLQKETTTKTMLSTTTPKTMVITSGEVKTHTTTSPLQTQSTTNSKPPTKSSFQPKKLTTRDKKMSSTPLTINGHTTKMSTAPVTQLTKNGTSTEGYTTSQASLSPNKEVTTHIVNPSTSSLPTKENIQTVDLSIQSIQGPILVTQSTNLTIHGHVKLVKDNGVTFVSLSGSNAWIEVPRQRFPCMNHLESCQSGFTFQVAILIQKINRSDKFVILSTGNEISSTMNLYYEANTLHASIIRGKHMWTLAVSYTLTMRQTHTYQVSWSTTEGLTLFVDNVLVGTQHQWITVQSNLVVNESLHIGRTDAEILVTNIQMWTATREVLGQIGILNKPIVPCHGTPINENKNVVDLTFETLANKLLTTTDMTILIHGKPEIVIFSNTTSLDLTLPGSYMELEASCLPCLSNLPSCTSGFTIQLQITPSNLDKHQKNYIIHNGPGVGSSGISLYYENGSFKSIMVVGSSKWLLNIPFELHENVPCLIHLSWHPTSGLTLHINQYLLEHMPNTLPAFPPGSHQHPAMLIGKSESLNHTTNMIVTDFKIYLLPRDKLVQRGILPPALTTPSSPTLVPPTQPPLPEFSWNFENIKGTYLVSSYLNLTIHGNPTPGHNGLEFSKPNQHLDINHLGHTCLTDVSRCTHGLTVSMEIVFKHLLENTVILTTGSETPDHPGISILYRYGHLQFVCSSTTKSWFASISREHLKLGDVYLLYMSCHNGLKVYLDKILLTTTTVPVPHPDTSHELKEHLYFGTPFTPPMNHLQCVLKNLHIWYKHIDQLKKDGTLQVEVKTTPAATSQPATSNPGVCPVGCLSFSECTTQQPTVAITKAPEVKTNPQTDAPTTEPSKQPTTDMPATKQPLTTEKPATKAPTTQAPATKAPTTQAPTTTKAPTTTDVGVPPFEVTASVKPITDTSGSYLTCTLSPYTQENVQVEFQWHIEGQTQEQITKFVTTPLTQGRLYILEIRGIIDNTLFNKQIYCSAKAKYTTGHLWSKAIQSSYFTPSITTTPSPNHKLELIEGSHASWIELKPTCPAEFLCKLTDKGHCKVEVSVTLTGSRYDRKCTRDTYLPQIVVGSQGSSAPVCGQSLTGNWTQSIKIPIKATIDGLRDRDQTRWVQVQLKMTGHLIKETYMKTIGSYQVVAKDKDVYHSSTCASLNDPHITTFDGSHYDNQFEGEYVLYRHQSLPYEVRARYQSCNPQKRGGPTCNCAVAIKSGDDVITLSGCHGHVSSGHHSFFSRFFHHSHTPPITVEMYKNGELTLGTGIRRIGCGKQYEIRLPTGTVITVKSSYQSFINIWVKASAVDFKQTQGLCGYFSGERRNELRGPDNKVYPVVHRPDHFTKTWQVSESKTMFHGVIQEKTTTDIYCSCVEHTHMYCGPSLDIFRCTTTTTRDDITATLVRQAKSPTLTHRRRRREIVEEIEEQMDEPKPTYTEDEAREYCEDFIHSQTATQTCAAYVNVTDVQLQECADDLVATGMKEWAQSHLDSIVTECISEAERTVDFEGGDNSTMLSEVLPPDVMSSLCPSKCGNGQCVAGVCECHEGFTGDVCNVSSSTVPEILPVSADGTTCNIKDSMCADVPVMGFNFVESNTLTCFYQKIEVTSQVSGDGVWIPAPATYLSMYQVVCALPNPPHSAWVTVSNNGVERSARNYLHIIHDDCYDCSINDNATDAHCDRMAGRCVIEGGCYRDGEKKPGQACLVCDSDVGAADWTESSDPLCSANKLSETAPSEQSVAASTIGLAVVVAVLAACVIVTTVFFCRKRAANTRGKKLVEEGEYNFQSPQSRLSSMPRPNMSDISFASNIYDGTAHSLPAPEMREVN